MLHGVCCYSDVPLEFVRVGGETLIFVLMECKNLCKSQKYMSPSLKLFLLYIFAGVTEELYSKQRHKVCFSSIGHLPFTEHQEIN